MGKKIVRTTKGVLFRAEQPQEEPIFAPNPFAPLDTDPQPTMGEQISENVWDYTTDFIKNFIVEPIPKLLGLSEGWKRVKAIYKKGDEACDKYPTDGTLNIELPGLINWNFCVSQDGAEKFVQDPINGLIQLAVCYGETAFKEPFEAYGKTIQEAGDVKKLLNNVLQILATPELPFFPNPFRMWDCLNGKLAAAPKE